MNQGHRALLFVFLIFSSPPVFSKEEKSKTEAGAPCLDQNCPSIEGSLQTLQETTSDQMCKATQSKPECKGIKKDHLKGCSSSNIAVTAGKGALQCVLGVFTGILMFLTSTYKGIKSVFSDDEDPGMKAYLHAEFESASQDSGTVSASLETTKAFFGLLFSSMGDVYSCLNPIGLSKKMCAFITTGGIIGIFAGTAVAAHTPTIGVGTIMLGTGLAVGYGFGKVFDPDLSGSAGFLASLVSIRFAINKKGKMIKLLKANSALGKPLGLTIGVLLGTAGGAAAHDKQVQERIKEKIKIKIREFEEQEER